jgi:hypothetical protein
MKTMSSKSAAAAALPNSRARLGGAARAGFLAALMVAPAALAQDDAPAAPAQDDAAACDPTTHPHGCTDPTDAAAIAKELSNPAGSLASLTFKNQFRLYEGDLPDADDQSNYTLLFQPVFPFPLGTTESGGKENLFIRPAFPILVDQPTFGASGFKGVSAFGDIGFDVAYGVTEPNGWIFIGGMVGTLPTATDSRVAGKQLRLGPEAFVGKAFDWGLLGVFPNHQWNVTGWSDSQYSTSQLQLVANFNLGDGWVASSQPQMFYDWRDEQWTVPLNAQLAKTVQIGGLPVRIQGEVSYYVDGPSAFRDEWMIGINITPVVPNFINSWIRGD